ncbi:MAG: HNH endonuclease [Myxococcales bacterium]|nr:HNH endonuclease [Myxococcales bacterium]
MGLRAEGKDGVPAGLLPTGLRAPVLVLNRSFVPIRITTARMAFELLYQDRARAVGPDYELYDFADWMNRGPLEGHERIGTSRGGIDVPRVVLLSSYNRIPSTGLRLSRRNLFLRDDYTCQYCGIAPGVRDLNIDHVVPRCRGGAATWENLVTSCKACNYRKGRHLPEECGMFPAKKPVRPRWTASVQLRGAARAFREWAPYLESMGLGSTVRKAG